MNPIIIVPIISIIVLLWFLTGFKIVRQNERGILEKYGKFHKIISPGKCYVNPITARLYTFDVSPKTIKITGHPVITKDNITCMVDVNVSYAISDLPESVRKMFYEDYRKEVTDHIKSEILDAFSLYTLKEIPHSKIKITGIARNNSIALSKHYTITNIEFVKISYPQDIQESINKVIVKQNEKEAAKQAVEAEKIKSAGLKKIQDEQAEAIKTRIFLESETRRRAIETTAKAEAEAIDMIKQKADTSYKEIASDLKKLFDEAKEKSVRKIKDE